MSEQVIYFAVALALLMAAGFVVVVSMRRIAQGDITPFRAAAVEQFNTWLVSSAASQLGLHPEACEIVQESESIGQNRNGVIYSYTLTRFLRGPHGQYVMFKSTPRRPYVKPVASSVAKAVLKERYVPPTAG
jgi:hypothetical protein